MRFAYIYQITNKLNNKSYIGQRFYECEKREDIINDSYMRSAVDIKKDIKLYGTLNFEKEILDYANTQEELDKLEIKYITEGKSKGKCEYNKTFGGQKTKYIINKTQYIYINRINLRVSNLIKRINTVYFINKYIYDNKIYNINLICEYLKTKTFVYDTQGFIYKYINTSISDIKIYYDELIDIYSNNISFINKKYVYEIDNLIDKIKYIEIVISDKTVSLKTHKIRAGSNKDLLYKLFEQGYKNKKIQEETNINYNTINKCRTQYNKEHKLINN